MSSAPAPRPSPNLAIVGIVVTGFLIFVIVMIVFLGFAGLSFFPEAGFLFVLCIPVLIVILIGVTALAKISRRRTIPPPPPIQQRMVPAGQQGPVALDCPNCGGPPTNVDRFGIATCSYCGTRFLVR